MSPVQSFNSTPFLSPIFTIFKKKGEQRSIINQRQLNKSVVKQHFKMEGTHLLSDVLAMNDWMVSGPQRGLLCNSHTPTVPKFNSQKFQFTVHCSASRVLQESSQKF